MQRSFATRAVRSAAGHFAVIRSARYASVGRPVSKGQRHRLELPLSQCHNPGHEGIFVRRVPGASIPARGRTFSAGGEVLGEVPQFDRVTGATGGHLLASLMQKRGRALGHLEENP
jgi:hypothetical protein